ncbi:hypothetical protein [Paenibacillus naphthalenovorans]|uniref:hypothetical protein n=1 Tax=Paenibacillus naphthalenovorans TaxID=162209 RepID=UPI0010BBD87F|nr:hypothetical protein [Paenibacillus naphthalenovorans]GCL72972.1 hypothetical protein PN4B1_29080 [Paenibacillus naphthalenovorans]
MNSKAVTEFLNIYKRKEEELLSPEQLESKGVFSGEKEFIDFAERDYNTDKHWAFEIKKTVYLVGRFPGSPDRADFSLGKGRSQG